MLGRRVGDVMYEVIVMGVGKFLRRLMLDFGKDEGG